eukprot:sb/3470407/
MRIEDGIMGIHSFIQTAAGSGMCRNKHIMSRKPATLDKTGMGVHRPFYVDSPSTLDDNRDEGDFAVDPDQLHDKLPQPFRLVDKILNGLFEDAWSLIAKRQNEMEFEANRRHLPKVDGGAKVVLPYPLHCMNTTPDGKLLLAVGKGGILSFTGEDPTRPVYKLNNESGGYLQIDSTQGSEPSTYIAATLNPTVSPRTVTMMSVKH